MIRESKTDKLKERLRKIPRDFTFDETVSLLTALGFEQDNKGKTSGSRIGSIRDRTIIILTMSLYWVDL